MIPLLRRDWQIWNITLNQKESPWIWKFPDILWKVRNKAWVYGGNHGRYLTLNGMCFNNHLGKDGQELWEQSGFAKAPLSCQIHLTSFINSLYCWIRERE
jgi:hypothetical protein